MSEILLQQTQAARVQPVYEAFVNRWPRAQDLYGASLADVKALTDPLGYHIRGFWLKELARHIVEYHGGQVPDDLKTLRGIPGLGPYAAAAVYVFGLRRSSITGIGRGACARPATFRLPPGLDGSGCDDMSSAVSSLLLLSAPKDLPGCDWWSTGCDLAGK